MRRRLNRPSSTAFASRAARIAPATVVWSSSHGPARPCVPRLGERSSSQGWWSVSATSSCVSSTDCARRTGISPPLSCDKVTPWQWAIALEPPPPGSSSGCATAIGTSTHPRTWAGSSVLHGWCRSTGRPADRRVESDCSAAQRHHEHQVGDWGGRPPLGQVPSSTGSLLRRAVFPSRSRPAVASASGALFTQPQRRRHLSWLLSRCARCWKPACTSGTKPAVGTQR